MSYPSTRAGQPALTFPFSARVQIPRGLVDPCTAQFRDFWRKATRLGGPGVRRHVRSGGILALERYSRRRAPTRKSLDHSRPLYEAGSTARSWSEAKRRRGSGLIIGTRPTHRGGLRVLGSSVRTLDSGSRYGLGSPERFSVVSFGSCWRRAARSFSISAIRSNPDRSISSKRSCSIRPFCNSPSNWDSKCF